MVNSFKNFYIFTGKGGVGKTTLALSFCQYLASQKEDYLYIYFQSQSSKPTSLEKHLKENEITSMPLHLMDCAERYISKKLNSKTIAHWIVKTPFFASLINMIPGFSYVIYLGQILEILLKDPKKIIVLDSPSSGHALTMLESTKNFNDIFQDGIIYKDTNLMLNTMKSPGFTKINIITIPTQLAINESIELKEKIQNLENYDVEITCNNSMSEYDSENLPSALKEKIRNEKLALSDYTDRIHAQIRYSTASGSSEIIKDLVPSLQNLV
jgi:arsenite-transporting ATPase